MPFELASPGARRIAIIGGGISGMAAAHLLADTAHVVLFEAEPEFGGHARTRMAGANRDVAVDTGFIVFNNVNYPHLTRLFNELDVPVAPSDMSFGASIDGGWLEYALQDLGSLFAQKRNLVRPKFWRLARDVYHFNKHALATVKPGMTVGDLVKTLDLSDWFLDYYISPFSGAIWSMPTAAISDFPAKAMVDFFKNHALLHHSGQHQWYTVQGGSIEYVRRLTASLQSRGVDLRAGTPVASIERDPLGATVYTQAHAAEHFDAVILATHTNTSLRLLADPRAEETKALTEFKYQPNDIVLHSDPSVMPKRKAVWSSWNYVEAKNKSEARIDLTYWMNRLQPLETDQNYFVTMNGTQPIDPNLIWDQVSLDHPVYDHAALESQAEVKAFNGTQNTWYCGAWMGSGFHEDGFASAVSVVEAMATRDAAPIAAE
ncbi:MAG: FAD-dependent oxidoreductase [Pseudomonadota bacterium]